MFVSQLLNGITLGSIYALIALGYTMVYGILRMINFAHSELFMLGAFFGLFFMNVLSPLLHAHGFVLLLLTFSLSMICSGVCGVFIEKLAYRPLRSSGRLTPLISAIGVSIFLQNFVMIAVSPQSLPMTNIFPVVQFELGPMSFSAFQLFVLGVAITLMVVLHFFISKTRMG
ncbi:MAG: branched-chain amino acid ABC transporter permease, partial [Candidatus Margulisiibacteriota bacterium]